MKLIRLYISLLLGCCSVPAAAQIITTVAGNGTYGYSGNGGPATSAQMAWQMGVTTDNAGNIYICDHDNNVIRMVNSSGIISNYAGTSILGYAGDGGPAAAARLYHPSWLCTDNADNIYFVDQNGDVIRKIDHATGIITTITGNLPAGYSGDGGPLVNAQFFSIAGISFDASGNMYIADNGNNVIRKVNAAGIINTVAGNHTQGYSGDGGAATAAALHAPYAPVFDQAGNMYIPDLGNYRIRKVTAAGIISTYAGTGVYGYTGDGGPATAAALGFGWTLAIDNADNLYIGDAGNDVVRKVTPAGIISTYAGTGVFGNTGDGGPANLAQLGEVATIHIDASNNLFISVRDLFYVIRKVINCTAPVVVQQPASVSLCNSGNATFSIIGNLADSYQWQVNTGSGWTNITDNSVYAGSGTVNLVITGANTSMNNYQYRCALVNSCTTVYTQTVTLTVATPVTPDITIASGNNTFICSGTTVVFSSVIVNGGQFPAYTWKKNGVTVSTSQGYTTNNLVTGDVITCELLSSASCVTAATATSNAITVTVTPTLISAVSLTASATTICAGTPVTFTANPVNGGSNPTYVWIKNGVPVTAPTTNATYTDNALNNGDIISCYLFSSYQCVANSNVPSPPVTISVTTPVTPAITINASATAVCKNTAVVFTALATGGGTTPVYQWTRNGSPIGTNSASYTLSNPANGDIIACTLTSSASCKTAAQATSNNISITINPDPVVTLDHTPALCQGSSRVLDAGAFASYLWSTGSVNRSITVTTTGTYSVTVTDNNGCTGTDATVINTLLPSPTNFLPADTAVCSYGSIVLQAPSGYTRYLWNTGAAGNAITVTQPGQYWLEVTDRNNCTGKDFITVAPKSCIKGFFMPTGFTPGNDGKNDILKPLLYGNVKQYRFWVYNRWGQVVFQTSNLSEGWDGTFGGARQDANVFAWMCTYQFDGEPLRMEKGTVMLIR